MMMETVSPLIFAQSAFLLPLSLSSQNRRRPRKIPSSFFYVGTSPNRSFLAGQWRRLNDHHCHNDDDSDHEMVVGLARRRKTMVLMTLQRQSAKMKSDRYSSRTLVPSARSKNSSPSWICLSRVGDSGRVSKSSIAPPLNFLYNNGLLIMRALAFVGTVLVAGFLCLYVQSQTQAYIERYILPPLSSMVGTYLGRKLDLGRVRSVSPFGITLESCSLSPHSEEFSTGHLPTIEIKIRPFTSIRKRQVVLDAVVVQPNILISQKRDWTWLGIPAPSGKHLRRSSSEEGLDHRTKTRRLAREEMAKHRMDERDQLARESAKNGYGFSNQHSLADWMSSSSREMAKVKGKGKMREWEVTVEDEASGGVDYGEHMSEAALASDRFSFRRPLQEYKTWLDSHFVRPIRLFKQWSSKGTSDKLQIQRRNLARSAAAAKMYFDKIDHGLLDPTPLNRGNNTSLPAATTTYDFGLSSVGLIAGLVSDDNDTMSKKELPFTVDNHSSEEGMKSADCSDMPIHEALLDAVQEKENDRGHFVISTGRAKFQGVEEDKMSEEPSFLMKGQLDDAENEKGGEIFVASPENTEGSPTQKTSNNYNPMQTTGRNGSSYEENGGVVRESSTFLTGVSVASELVSSKGVGFARGKYTHSNDADFGGVPSAFGNQLHSGYINLNDRARMLTNKLLEQAKKNIKAALVQNWVPVALESIYFKGGTLMLLAYGDSEVRVMENINGYLKFGNNYDQVDVHLIGNLIEWRKSTPSPREGGNLLVKVYVDVKHQKWRVKLKGSDLYAPLLERLLEIPLDWTDGRANGELNLWASKGDRFPNLAGRLNVSNLGFKIWESPSAFKEVSGTLFFQGQRMFLHNTKGFFGAVPLHVSGDMDLNPESGEYRLVCQVPNVEVNALMKTMRAQPPLHPVAGALKAAVYCRGPLEAPVFAGSAEILKKDVNIAFNRPLSSSAATEAIQQNESRGAVAAFDRVPFSFASANFTFDTDNCIADLYGLRAALVDGGEIRGVGSMWICPEGEVDSTAVNVDLSGNLLFDGVIKNYVRGMTVFPVQLGSVHGEAKVRGALLRPSFDISWSANDAKGSFTGVRGDINISHECIVINSSAWTFDLFSKIETSYPPIAPLYRRRRFEERQPPSPPQIEGLEVDLRLKGFDFLGLAPPLANNPTAALHMKATGKAKFQGHVVKRQQEEHTVSGVAGEMTLSGLRLNQFLVAPHLVGALDVFPGSIKLNATGRTDEHLFLEISGSLKPTSMEQIPVHASVADSSKNLLSFSLERGQLRTSMDYQPGRSAKLEVRNLHLDELELASLRGTVQKAEMQLNFYKHKGHGKISVRRPRFSGVQGESLDLACRWSGDVITIEKSVLEQASSRYELQGEYVLPGPRDHSKTKINKGDGNWKSAMAGQLGRLITSMGRWRLRLEVPGAEVVEMLPMARLLSRSSDPAVVSRSKELFMQGLQNAGFNSENLKQQIDNIRKGRSSPAFEEGSPETIPLPGLAELKGHWHGTFEASGGGNGDTMADFNFHGEEWEWGTYKTQRVVAVGSYDNSGLHLEKMFIQKDTATLHADGTVFGPKPNLHFAVLNFPIGLVPPLVHAFQSSTFQPVTAPSAWTPLTSIKGILYMEGDLRGSVVKPQCDLQVRLLDGSVGGVDLGRAEVSAAITSSNRFIFNANFEPAIRSGHVHVKGSLPVAASDLDIPEEDDTQKEIINMKRSRGGYRYKSRIGEHFDGDEKKNVQERLGDEGWEVNLAESLKGLDWDAMDEGALQVDATVKDGGMLLITALSPYVHWLQGNADLKLQVRGTVDQPEVDGTAVFHRVYMSSPVLPRVLSNFGGTIRVHKNQLCVESLEGRVGRKGRLQVKGKLPLKAHESSATSATECIELKADMLEVRAKNVFSGQVDGHMQCIGSLLEPEVSGMIKLSHGEAYLPQEKGDDNTASMLASGLPGMPAEWQLGHLHKHEVIPPSSSSVAVAVATLPEHIRDSTAGSEENMEEENEQAKPPIAMRLKGVKLNLGPELRVVYPLILNFSVSGNLELNGLADPHWIKPKGTLMFENGDVNLVATQVRLNRDYPNCAKFEPEQGLDPILDLVLVGADWQLKVQGRARNWQRNLLLTSTRSGEPDGHEAARVFESQLAESLLEGDGQLAFKKLAAATVETLMPKIEGKGEFGQARWRLVSAPQIPNLLSLDPTTDPFKSLANLSFGTEVELQLGKRLQASVVRQVKESEMATQWTLIYQLNNKLRILFSSIPSVDNRLLFEYSATSQN